MFTALVLTPDTAVSSGLERLAVESQQVSVLKALNRYPQTYELVSLVNSCDPELVFLDVGDWQEAARVAAKIQSLSPKTVIVGFGGGWNTEREEEYAEAGIGTLLVSPVTLKEFRDGVARAFHKVRSEVQRNLLAFLPAKAGSGCTVTALNVAGCLAGALNQRVLLVESDLRSGILPVLTKSSPEFHLQDVLENPSVLNHSEWDRFVSRTHGIDLLPANRSRRGALPNWNDYYHLLRYVESEYNTAVADLPEVVNDATAEIVRRARSVLIVSTAELPSLELARQRCEELDSRGVDPERISFVLNRWQQSDMPPADVERILLHPVLAVLPEDSRIVRSATAEGQLVPQTTGLGKSYLSLAEKLAVASEDGPPSSRSAKARFGIASLLSR